MYIVDSHCHLDYDVFDADRGEMMQRAADLGIKTMMTIGTQFSTMDAVLKIANDNTHIYATTGIHPHHADETDETLKEKLLEWAKHPKVVGLGETGLDYFYEHSDREKQKTSFRTHCDVARQTGLPLIIHSRDAEQDTLSILQEEKAKGDFAFLIHCFTASLEFGQACIDMGGYISISGIVTFKKADDLRKAVQIFPLNRLLIETDSPYLAPIPHRGKRNEPSFVYHVAQELSLLRGESVDDICRQTTENYFTLFKKAVKA